MPVSGYLLDQFDEDELSLVLAIHNNLSDNKYMDYDTIKCMKMNHFIQKIIESKDKANKDGVDKINIILNKIDEYVKA
jgi:hypothetical protein